MDPNSMSGGIYSNVQTGNMLGLEMSLHQPLAPPAPPQNPQNPHLLQNPHHQILNYAHLDENYHPQAHQPQKPAHPISAKPKAQTLTLSDDDEPGFTAETSAEDGRKKMTSPWQRMKWTDNMVRLLIMIVFYIGDEVVSEAHNSGGNNNTADKKKGVLQKKGKWKSVSRAMMERGFYVSPQQCEDKFNDLNKRYKRVNDILGKGISCRVVENQSLLDSMDHISAKMKDEVRKLLNSKHLFFREMCAYHNSCGNAGAAGTGVSAGGAAAELPPAAPAEPQRCLHSTPDENNNNNNNINTITVPNLNRLENEGTKLSKWTSVEDDDDDDEEDDDVSNDDEDDDEGTFSDNGRESSRKRQKRDGGSRLARQVDSELASMLQDGSKSRVEKRQFLKMKMARLDEERLGIQTRAFEIERRRLKWLKYSRNKEREMERDRLANERLRLENERMVLVIRQKELDLLDQHQHLHQQQYSSNRKSDPSSVTG